LLYWLNACSTALLHASVYDFDLDHCDLASIEQAIRKPIKGASKVALRFVGARPALLEKKITHRATIV
jgi:hypothetical protein